MRSSSVFVAFSVGVTASSSQLSSPIIKRQLEKTGRDTLSNAVDCSGEIYNNICCVNGEWSGSAVVSVIASNAAGHASSASAYYSANSASIQGDLSTAASNGASWVNSNSASLQGDLSTLSTFIVSNSASLRNDLSSAQPFISGLKSTLAPIEATITPPPNPFGKREMIIVDQASIDDVVNNAHNDLNRAKPIITSLASSLIPIEATITPPPNPLAARRNTIVIDASSLNSNWENNGKPFVSNVQNSIASIKSTIHPSASSIIQHNINDGINALHSAEPAINSLKDSLAPIEATYVPPNVIFNKRSVTVVSQGLTCHGQAAVTLTASNAASLVASATSAAKGTRYYANGSSGTLAPSATSKSTSISTGSAAIITRGPMLAVGGAAVAFAFAAI